jgi:hypothetical protein
MNAARDILPLEVKIELRLKTPNFSSIQCNTNVLRTLVLHSQETQSTALPEDFLLG